MAQFTVKFPNGAEVTFDGDVSFAELQEFLDREDPPALLRGPAGSGSENHGEGSGEANVPSVALDPSRADAQFAEVGARSDVERVTVLAWLARKAGAPGVDQETAMKIYRELALPMPGVWRSTFSNAATRGYIVNEGRGMWRPTSAGENFARLGQRRPTAARRTKARSKTTREDDG